MSYQWLSKQLFLGMKILNEIKNWPPKRKQFFSLIVAIFLTLIILFSSILINAIFFEKETVIESKYSPMNRMTESFKGIFKEAGEEADKIFMEVEERLEQINATSSSSSIDINIVE